MWSLHSILNAVKMQIKSDFHTVQDALMCISVEISSLLNKNRQAKRISVFIVWNLLLALIILLWALDTKSMCLMGLVQLVVLDILYLLVSMSTLWLQGRGPTPLHTFGYARYEVVSVFVATMLAIFSALFLLKEAIERIFEFTPIQTDYQLFSGLLTLLSHIVTLYSVENPSMQHVIQASSSSWLQEQVTDLCESLCSVVPCLSRFLLPRLNPVLLVGVVGSLVVVGAHAVVAVSGAVVMDTLVAVFIACMLFATVMPMANYSGRILLQTTPGPLLGQIDKALREAGTIDGVLEVKKRHFWTVGFGQLAGSVHVRVRRDANEQLVLAHITARLEPLAQHVTVQVFKDDWTRGVGSSYAAFQRHAPPSLQPYLQPQLHSGAFQIAPPSSMPQLPQFNNPNYFQQQIQTGNEKNLPDLVPPPGSLSTTGGHRSDTPPTHASIQLGSVSSAAHLF